jgi:hypothetical protein
MKHATAMGLHWVFIYIALQGTCVKKNIVLNWIDDGVNVTIRIFLYFFVFYLKTNFSRTVISVTLQSCNVTITCLDELKEATHY